MRTTICQTCQNFHPGGWCSHFDDNHSTWHNCDQSKHARWIAAAATPEPRCPRWSPPPCPCCTIDDPIPDPELQPPPDGWTSDPAVVARHLAGFREMAAREYAPPAGLAGDGIVTYGDARVWPMLVVAAKVLRRTGSTIPLQIWRVGEHRGHELDGDRHTVLVDADEFTRWHPARKADSWARKSYAIAHSGFARCLFLDPDAYCVSDPAPLFALLDEYVFAYWANIPFYHQKTGYELLRPLVGETPWAPPVQGGAFLLDCKRAWKELMIQRWWDNHADFWWRRSGNSDEDGWRTIITYLASRYHMIGPDNWGNIAFSQSWQGVFYVVHRCQGKLWGDSIPPTDASLPREAEVLEILASHFPASTTLPESEPHRKARLKAERRALLGMPIHDPTLMQTTS